MKSSDRTILVGLAVIALAAAFYFLVLAPKRQEASDLSQQVTELEAQVTQTEADAAAGEAAKSDFSSNYKRMVTLGKAVPVDADTPSLLTELQTLATRSKVDFQSISLTGGATQTAVTPAPAATATATDPAAASEAAASMLPIGATVGTAGLPVMPYEMEFRGGFFEIADFFGAIDGMVQSNGEKTTVDGRLLTIDGFNFTPGPDGLPQLTANVTATSYLTPADQGITAGASPTGPAAETPVPAVTPSTTGDPAVAAAVVSN